MILYKEIKALQPALQPLRAAGKSIGFVPTMGALHNGHLSLIERSRQENDLTVCSIFVNPTQFNDPKDFEKYPVTIENDIAALEKAGNDVLFLPSVTEMYPDGTTPKVHYNLDYLETILEGAHRPGHFQGVCQVVHHLLNIVQPNNLYLGQKDYQQIMVIKAMIRQFQLPTMVHAVPTIRENSGLAMSSRNMRLSNGERSHATAIYEALSGIKTAIQQQPIARLEQQAQGYLLQHGFEKVDYVSICQAETLLPATDADKHLPLVALAAAFIGPVRLIDNLLLQ
ncbi:pantoate--beta-alanine ligase [Deminuibacter soli]|uniref:Pantothenate synthetase n=1 Tax=Deminuibacter soli TaxID=2291815 RepID=A0A3E1NIT8_9BACT|nr:pantoate--beta-alanine ligase [Deminuibacter soli]RFM27698.1 pantoate--beta-alanine ligase [Deminuibacter soli]